MSTIILKNLDEVFLIPDWTMEHAGFSKNKKGQNIGHTDIKNSTGSTFNSSINALSLFNQLINDEKAEHIDAVYQSNFISPVGWSALDINAPKITGVVLKQEAPEGSKIASTVLAPAYENESFGDEKTQTTVFSAIAPLTTQTQFLPDDVKDNSTVLKAMKDKKLRTFVSIFPGPIIINHQALPKVSQFEKGIAFQVHPENNMYIKINASSDLIYQFIKNFNQKSLSENKECNIEKDKEDIHQLTKPSLDVKEKREIYLATLNSNMNSKSKLVL